MKDWDLILKAILKKLEGQEPKIVEVVNDLLSLAVAAGRLEGWAVDNETLCFSSPGEREMLTQLQSGRAKFRMVLARIGVLAEHSARDGEPFYSCSGVIRQGSQSGQAASLTVETDNTPERQRFLLCVARSDPDSATVGK